MAGSEYYLIRVETNLFPFRGEQIVPGNPRAGVRPAWRIFSALGAALVAIFLLSQPAKAAPGAQSPCDLNADGVVNYLDVQLAVSMSLGSPACTANVYGANVCNAVVVQRVINASLNGGTCMVGNAHTVTLNWTASTSPNIAGYNVYRSTISGSQYTKINSSLAATTSYSDATVQAGLTYYYVTTAVDTGGNESTYSNQATAVIPNP